MSDDSQIPSWMRDLYARDQELADNLPPAELDTKILQLAEDNLVAAPEIMKPRHMSRFSLGSPWLSGTASAAVVLLTVTLVLVAPPDQIETPELNVSSDLTAAKPLSLERVERVLIDSVAGDEGFSESEFHDSDSIGNTQEKSKQTSQLTLTSTGSLFDNLRKKSPDRMFPQAEEASRIEEVIVTASSRSLAEPRLVKARKINHAECAEPFEIPADVNGLTIIDGGATYMLGGQALQVLCIRENWQITTLRD